MTTRPHGVHLLALAAVVTAVVGDAVLWSQVSRAPAGERAAWVTASAAIAVGVVGFVGAWLGAWRTHLHSVQESARESRRDAYAEFLAHAADLSDALDAVLDADGDVATEAAAARWRDHQSRYSRARLEARRVVARIQLVGSPVAHARARQLVEVVEEHAGGHEGAVDDRRERAATAVRAATDSFLVAAQTDLGVRAG